MSAFSSEKLINRMESDRQWQLSTEKSSEPLSSLFADPSIFSPDGSVLCRLRQSSVDMHSVDGITSIPVPVDRGETLTCIENISTDPWILAAGTNAGNLFVFSRECFYFQTPVHTEPIRKLRVCNFTDSLFTISYPSLLVMFPSQIIAIIQLSDILPKTKPTSDIPIQKWQIHHSFTDAILVNSGLASPLITSPHRFPALLSIGSSPFFCVSYVSKSSSSKTSELVKTVATRFLRWIAGSDEQQKEPPIPKSSFEWSLTDEGRQSKSCCPDPTGRWLAIVDSNGRVLILDCIFGFASKVLKGLRDAQTAWIGNGFLTIFAPHRGMLVMVEVPSGEIVDAIKVDKGGSLFQISGRSPAVAFVSSQGQVTVIQTKAEKKVVFEKTDEAISFSLPPFLTARTDPIVSRILNFTSGEDPIGLIKDVTSPSHAATIIRGLISEESISDEVLSSAIQDLDDKFSAAFSLIEKPKSFFQSHKTAETQFDEEFSFSVLRDLKKMFEKAKSLKSFDLPRDTLVKFVGETSDGIVVVPPKPTSSSLKDFLLKPYEDIPALFSAMLSEEDAGIYEAYRHSRAGKKEFLVAFVSACLAFPIGALYFHSEEIKSFISDNDLTPVIDQILGETPERREESANRQFLMDCANL